MAATFYVVYRCVIIAGCMAIVRHSFFIEAAVSILQKVRTNDAVDICVLVPFDDSRMFSVRRVLPAVNLAASKVEVAGYISGLQVRIRVGNTGCNSRDGPIVAFEYYRRQQVSVFIGPVCDYSLAPVARYAPVWNIPVISPGGFAHDMVSKQGPDGEFPSLTRVGATFNSLTDSIVVIMMSVFRWSKVKVIYDGEAQSNVMPRFCYLAAASLVNMTKEKKMGHDFHIFLPGSHNTSELLIKEVGNEFGSKSGFY